MGFVVIDFIRILVNEILLTVEDEFTRMNLFFFVLVFIVSFIIRIRKFDCMMRSVIILIVNCFLCGFDCGLSGFFQLS